MSKRLLMFLFIAGLFFGAGDDCFGKKKNWKSIQPVLIDSLNYIYSTGNIYLAGQPSERNFRDLKNKGLVLVINLRTDDENAEHNNKSYNEEEYLKDLGLRYFHLSVDGTKKYDPAVVDKIAEKIKGANGKVMIHCRSAVRATTVWMAWLVRYQGYPLEVAVRLGKKARYSNPFEELLGLDIKMKEKK